MDPFGRSKNNQMNHKPAAELPQWNARFRFTAQKGTSAAADDSNDGRDAAKERGLRTPHLASGARRVPVGRKGSNPEEGEAADGVTPLTSDKTPTLCLFQRFENLTLSTPATATAAKPAGPCSGSAVATGVAAPASCSTTSSSNSSQAAFSGQAAAAAGTHTAAVEGRQRRSVAFGTPCVLAYTPSSPPAGAVQQDSTPLWSNAGHTPYSLDGKDSGEGGCVRAVFAADAAEEELDTISGRSSGTCMELFTSTITETELQSTPVPSMGAPRTPADAPAAAGAAARGAGLCAAGTSGHALPSVDPKSAAGHKAQQAAAAAAAAAPSFSSDSSFTGFGVGIAAPAVTGDEEECTPPFFHRMASAAEQEEEEEASTPVFFSKTVANAAAAVSSATSAGSCEASGENASHDDCASSAINERAGPAEGVSSRGRAAEAGAAVGATSSSSSMLGLATTPKSRLKQPARVPLEGSKPVIPNELKQLLSDPQAAAALQPSAALGTCDVLSPVRPKKQLQHVLGAGDQVLSPVRRSTRKAPKHVLAAEASAVTPMLEATNYCYQGRGDTQQQPFDQ